MGSEMSTLRPCKRYPPDQPVKNPCNKQLSANLKAIQVQAQIQAKIQAQAQLQAKIEARAEADAKAEASGQEIIGIIEFISKFPILVLEIKGVYYMVDPSFKALPGSTVFEKFINSLIQIGTLLFDASRYPTTPTGDDESIEQFARGPDLRKELEQEVQRDEELVYELLTNRPATGFLVAAPGENALQIYLCSAFNQLGQSRRYHIHEPQTLARRLAPIKRKEKSRMPAPPKTPSPKERFFALVRDFETSNALQWLCTLLPVCSQTSGSMQGPDGASFKPSKFLEFNADGVVVFTFEEKAPDKQINTWECLNWKEFTEEKRYQALKMYLSTCTDCWHTKHFSFVIDKAKALSKSLDEALDYKGIMDILYVLTSELNGAARREQNRILNWFLGIWEELEIKHHHELSNFYATVKDEFRLSQDFRRNLAGKARMFKETNVTRQLSLEDGVFLLFIIKIRRIHALEIGKALAEKRMAKEKTGEEIMAEEITKVYMEEYALAKKGGAKEKPKVRKRREEDAMKKAMEVCSKIKEFYSKDADEFVENETRPTSESERVRLRRDLDIVADLQDGGYGMLDSWVMTRDSLIGDLLYKIYQHVQANLQHKIDENPPSLQVKSLQKQEGSAVNINDSKEPQASGVQYPQGKNSQAENWNVDPDFDKGHAGTEVQKPQVEEWYMDPYVAEEFERILFQPFLNTREYILGLVKETDMAE